ncbi:hypothetical protein FACS189430_11220 [Bacteroidia bacterium]|nr:hypothetical protein FACS189430_11220 [Bacteroidia bacterium]
MLNVSQAWTVTLNTNDNTIIITAPAVAPSDTRPYDVTLFASDGGDRTIMRIFKLYYGVKIGETIWAATNVDDFGTFAATPEATGKLYQWNRKKAWDAVTDFVSGWDFTDDTGGSWETANDPSPAGWRVPTQAELESLFDADNVSNEWTTQNGVDGRKFTDKATKATLFLPAAGFRDIPAAMLAFAGTSGIYWSSTASGAETIAFYLLFGSDHAYVFEGGYRRCGQSVRSVAE